MIGSKWQPNVDGSRLQWAHGNNIEGPYTFPKDLYSEPDVLDDGTFRVDYWQGGEKTHWVVEAPIWSWWDHNGNGFHELYWSVGSSDPCETTGWSYIRRGDIKWSGTTPWIDILPGRILSENGTC